MKKILQFAGVLFCSISLQAQQQAMVSWDTTIWDNTQITGTYNLGGTNGMAIVNSSFPMNVKLYYYGLSYILPDINPPHKFRSFRNVPLGPYVPAPISDLVINFTTPVLIKGLRVGNVSHLNNAYPVYNDSFKIVGANFHTSESANCFVENGDTVLPILSTTPGWTLNGSRGNATLEYARDYVTSITIQFIGQDAKTGSLFWALDLIDDAHLTNITVCGTENHTVTPTNPGTYDYKWWLPSGATDPGNTATAELTSEGIYYCEVLDPATGDLVETFAIDVSQATGTPTTFTLPNTICAGAAMNFPTTSDNGITGIWSPAFTGDSGVYTFTPDSGAACYLPYQHTLTVTPLVTPSFTIADQMQCGTAFVLPLVSDEGIEGTWSPAFDTIETTTYTFTPDNADDCATTATHTITIVPHITPSFDTPQSVCVDEDSSQSLPVASLEGITGSWSLLSEGTTHDTYTFTPDPQQCALSTTLDVLLDPLTLPTFNDPGSVCSQDDAAALLAPTSLEGINGTWALQAASESVLTYTFSPSPGQCAALTTLDILLDPLTLPTFSDLGSVCTPDQAALLLPQSSLEGITGTWELLSSGAALITYTFLPDADQCADQGTASVVINPSKCIFPKGISPNGDGLNDNFDLSSFGVTKLMVYNRYGQEVYRKSNYSNEWHGQTDNGDQLPTGTYYFSAETAEGSRTGWVYINRQD